MKLIALCGLHGAGKDTVADALPARKLAFADTLYREVAEAFGVMVDWLRRRDAKEIESERLKRSLCESEEFDVFLKEIGLAWKEWCSPRQILQWWGDYRRAQDTDYFVRVTEQHVCNGLGSIVITDCRFPNEAAMVRQLGGQIWQIVRHGHNPPCNGHASENDGSAFKPDVVIINNGTLDELRATALQEWNK